MKPRLGWVVLVSLAGVGAALWLKDLKSANPSNPETKAAASTPPKRTVRQMSAPIEGNQPDAPAPEAGPKEQPGPARSASSIDPDIQRMLELAAGRELTPELVEQVDKLVGRGDGIVDEMCRLLKSDDLRVRDAASRVLLAIGNPIGVQAVVDYFLSNLEVAEAEELSRNFQSLADARNVDILISAVTNSQDHVVLTRMMEALGRTITPEGAERLGELLSDPGLEDWQHMNLAMATHYINSPAAVSALTDLALSTENENIRTACVYGLSHVGNEEAVRGLGEIIEQLGITNLEHEVVRKLAGVATDEGMAAAAKLFEQTTNEVVKYACSEALMTRWKEIGMENLHKVLSETNRVEL